MTFEPLSPKAIAESVHEVAIPLIQLVKHAPSSLIEFMNHGIGLDHPALPDSLNKLVPRGAFTTSKSCHQRVAKTGSYGNARGANLFTACIRDRLEPYGVLGAPTHRHKPIDDKPVLAFQYIHMGRNGECDTLDRRTRNVSARVYDGQSKQYAACRRII
mgnify:CR=1 FL=1